MPTVSLSRAQLASHLDDVGVRVPGDLAAAHVADLYLAAACAVGDTGALTTIEAGPLREIADFVARIDAAPDFGAEVTQLVRQKILLAPGEGQRPKIAAYSGRGPLGGWIRVVAVRVALDLRRSRGPALDQDGDADQIVARGLDPEAALLREQYREVFRVALNSGLADLSARERNLLRFHFADGVTLDQLATSYRVHRATVARWLARARANLLARIKGRLTETLGMSGGEVESIARLLGSQLDVSLSRLG